MMGDKLTAKQAVSAVGLPIVPGTSQEVDTLEDAERLAEEIGYPILVKAAAGGGGKGMKVADTADHLPSAFMLARSEAKAAFGNNAVYLEKFLGAPRHIEVQVLADSHGGVVHFGERDCSLQRRHQKVLEEAPSPILTEDQRRHIGGLVHRRGQAIGLSRCRYDGVPLPGTAGSISSR